ncbi:MAG: nucleotidyltransferase domain-containing protein [Fimbriimonadaceae bacterium]|nr:nucleotidyltransferase domain-containing protein [Fimbriimonadaceae bacterium]
MVPLGEISALARRIGEQEQASRVILFGSHAEGTASADSDVDLLVVLRHAQPTLARAAAIRAGLTAPFAIDILLHSEATARERLALGDTFLATALSRGMVLYEALD